MKKTIKLIGTVALAAILVFALAFTSCAEPGSGIGGGSGGSAGGGSGAQTGTLSTARYIWTDGVNDYDLHITGGGSRVAAASGNYTLTVTDKSTGDIKVIVGTASGSDTSITLSNDGGSSIKVTISGTTITIEYEAVIITTTGNVTVSAGNYTVIITDGSPYEGGGGISHTHQWGDWITDPMPFTSITAINGTRTCALDTSHKETRTITLSEYMSGLPANTAATPYTIRLNVSDLGGTYHISGSVGDVLISNPTKYVSLDLSGSTITNINSSELISQNSIISVTLPNTLTSIERRVFSSYSSNLTAINVDITNAAYSSQDGVLYNKNKTVLLQYPQGKTASSFTIPNSVTNIGDSAFSGTSLTNVSIPNSVTSIDSYAFSGSSLINVTIPNSVTRIENYTFSGCNSLTSITIHSSITYVGSEAFRSCTNFIAVNVDTNNVDYSSVDGVLYNKNKTTLVAYPAGKTGAFTIPSSVTSIDSYAFYYCSGLTSVTIPSSVTSIGSFAFNNCNNLTSVTFAGTIPVSRFGLYGLNSSPFDGDLRDKFYATNSTNGTPGTYTKGHGAFGVNTWTKQ